MHCLERLVGSKVTHYSTIPSTKGRAQHPLRALIAPFTRWPEHELAHVVGVNALRQAAQRDLFSTDPCPPGAHVLIVDDTWTSGNKAFSAITTLRLAGAAKVSVLCIARWVGFNFIQRPPETVGGLWASLATKHSYSLDSCPFTGATCP